MYKVIFGLFCIVILGCKSKKNSNASQNKNPVAIIESLHPSFRDIINDTARVEILAEGFDWTEGPVWVEDQQMLLFSDIPENIIYKWTRAKGTQVYLKPSGYTGEAKRGGQTGSNGLALTKDGKLVLCQHGNRQIAIMDAPLNAPKPNFKGIAVNYQGKKFNSPNDVTIRSNGDMFFTDPPYGLEKNMDDPLKEMPFQGVYKVTPAGVVTLLTDSVTRPNGIALTPDEKTLIVANSDKRKKLWYAFDLGPNDSLINPRIFYNVIADSTVKGSCDGLKIDKSGNVFATGPGGVWVFDSEGMALGRIKFPESTSNVALSADEKTLYITADMYILRVKMR